MRRKTVLITGASRGIGEAIALHLAERGYSVVLVSRSFDRTKRFEKKLLQHKYSAFAIRCDVQRSSDIARAVNHAKNKFGTIDILINNAGYGGPYQLTDKISESTWDSVFNTNVKSAFLFSKLVLPAMKAQKYGRIVNVASVLGLVGAAKSSAYAASKHALVGYTKSIASEVGSFGITCNTICPGYIKTKMTTGRKSAEAAVRRLSKNIPVGRLGTPHEIALLVEYLISPAAHYINGADIVIDGGLISKID